MFACSPSLVFWALSRDAMHLPILTEELIFPDGTMQWKVRLPWMLERGRRWRTIWRKLLDCRKTDNKCRIVSTSVCSYHKFIHSCPSLAVRPSLLLQPVLGIVCSHMSRPHPLRLFSEVASRLSPSGIPSRDFQCNLLLHAQWQFSFFLHLNHYCYLLLLASGIEMTTTLELVWNPLFLYSMNALGSAIA